MMSRLQGISPQWLKAWAVAGLLLLLSGCVALASLRMPLAPSPRSELTVFAAASLAEAMSEVARHFEQANPGVVVTLNFGGSSTLATQIIEGAPADIFAPANPAQMERVMAEGLMEPPRFFASNRLAVILPARNPADINRLADLTNPGIRLVLAIPGVPARDYGETLLARLSAQADFPADFAQQVRANLVSEEENVRQVVAKVALGEADAGIVYHTDITGDVADRVRQIPIPDEINVVALYPAARLSAARQADLADQFLALLLSAEGQAILARWGFDPVE
jgi:molybdate transport system substrate-binding protein